MTTVKEVLEQATDVLMEQGWCQGSLKNDAGNVCAVGAVEEVRKSLDGVRCHCNPTCDLVILSPEELSTVHAAKHALAAQIGTDEIANWNDATGRTAEDVILAFKQAAATAED